MGVKVSVATVVFNDVNNLEATIQSVLSQVYDNLEYLVIDGGSTDGTLDIINKYSDRIAIIQTGKDKGVYDAMNKATLLSTGDYVNFMNAGDIFASPQTVENIFKGLKNDPDLIYGDHDVVYPTFVKHKKALPTDHLWKHMAFSHQSLFTKRSLLLQHPFDLSYRVSADFHFIYNRYRAGAKFLYTGQKIAIYQSGGHSEKQVMQGYFENRKIVLAHDRKLKVQWFHFRLILKQWLIVGFRQLVPTAVFERLMAWKNRVKG